MEEVLLFQLLVALLRSSALPVQNTQFCLWSAWSILFHILSFSVFNCIYIYFYCYLQTSCFHSGTKLFYKSPSWSNLCKKTWEHCPPHFWLRSGLSAGISIVHLAPSPHSPLGNKYTEHHQAKFICCWEAALGMDLTLQFSVQVIHQFNLLFFKNLSLHVALLIEEYQQVSTNHSGYLLGKAGEAWQFWQNTSVDKMHGGHGGSWPKPFFQTIDVCQQL